MPDIRIASSASELAAVYRFRYAIYVEEMHYTESHADHAGKLLADPLDRSAALVLAAWEEGRVIGTVRLNRLSDGGGVDRYLQLYRLDTLSTEALQHTSLCTRLMVHPDFRRATLAVRLCCEMYRWGLEQGLQTDYCDCAPGNVSFFAKLGYRVEFSDFEHPEFGPGTVMRLDLHDLEHLEAVRSPFHRILLASQGQAGARLG